METTRIIVNGTAYEIKSAFHFMNMLAFTTIDGDVFMLDNGKQLERGNVPVFTGDLKKTNYRG